jgi:hypothetical protein
MSIITGSTIASLLPKLATVTTVAGTAEYELTAGDVLKVVVVL